MSAIDTTTGLDIELAEWLDRSRTCEPAVGAPCDNEAAWWLVMSCGHTFAACSYHKAKQMEYVESIVGLVDCMLHGTPVTWRWEPIS